MSDATPPLPEAIAARHARIAARPVVLELRGVGKRFAVPGGEVTALAGIDLQVRRREFVAVVGPSGCGKSTLARIVAGLEPHTAGEVLLDGRPVAGPDRDRGMVFQGYTLFPWLSVARNVMFGPRLQGVDGDTARAEALQWLDVVGLGRFADAYPHQLSGGMKQRVAIARALANRPRVLLMDEPFGALDEQTRAGLQDFLHQLWLNVDLTVVFITHDLDEAVLLADRVVALGASDATHPGGHLREIVPVPLPVPRHAAMAGEPAFVATRLRLEALVRGQRRAPERAAVPRLVPVGDDVW